MLETIQGSKLAAGHALKKPRRSRREWFGRSNSCRPGAKKQPSKGVAP
ncbi:MAG: hypothetical protein HRJ53_22110 [Acidobacteria bacterium Pan2503]|uniref:Uncharacterized protein n=1 Tax=Candidatus Acidiferrum panamense TaxID=2741543 RepID=A0A7V8SZ34_9BACT|nr:hypothetical protein [Candidatus Acidoferrum panamensis]